ncbi:hypothetical protein OG984_00250 [Nocardioides sp. NBC_00368]|uniref:hypothetical protein n=1 Tax=Nocardioides sp. NBC_00368 TaxID=2976000 RepID=UPI002E22EFE7
MSEASNPIQPIEPVGYPAVVTDPIRSVRTLRRFEFVRAPLEVSADADLVLVGADGSLTTYMAAHQPTRGELAWRNYVKLYEVDRGYHHQFFEYDLPSSGDAFFFHTEVDVTWHVFDSGTVVRSGVHDVRTTIEPELRKVLISRTRQFQIEKNAEAEIEVNRALEQARIGEHLGLRVSCIVRLTLDAQALEHFTALRQQRYQTEQNAEQHITNRAATQQKHELTRQNTEFFQQFLNDEDAMWALLIAQNPGNVTHALEGLRSDKQQTLATKAQLAIKLLEEGRLEDHQLEDPARMATETMLEILETVANSSTAQRQPQFEQQLPQPTPDPGADDEDRRDR